MSILDVFHRSRALLGVDADADAATIKRAYRRKVAEHPPDQDPETFQKLREAYELLTAPLSRLQALLVQPTPDIELPPPPQVAPLPPAATARALLSALVAELDITLPEDPPHGR